MLFLPDILILVLILGGAFPPRAPPLCHHLPAANPTPLVVPHFHQQCLDICCTRWHCTVYCIWRTHTPGPHVIQANHLHTRLPPHTRTPTCHCHLAGQTHCMGAPAATPSTPQQHFTPPACPTCAPPRPTLQRRTPSVDWDWVGDGGLSLSLTLILMVSSRCGSVGVCWALATWRKLYGQHARLPISRMAARRARHTPPTTHAQRGCPHR